MPGIPFLKGADMRNRHHFVAGVLVLFLALAICWAGQTSGQATEADVATGQLAIDGKFILSLVLEDESGELIGLGSAKDARVYRPARASPKSISRFIDLPAAGETVSLPAGRYRWNSVTVSDETKKLKFGTNQAGREWIELRAGSTTTLRIAGPLKHTVRIGRVGGVLNLDYALLGAAGEKYLPVPAEPSEQPKAPDLAIYKAGDKIFSGSFRYG
jgi:hypothetical protein